MPKITEAGEMERSGRAKDKKMDFDDVNDLAQKQMIQKMSAIEDAESRYEVSLKPKILK